MDPGRPPPPQQPWGWYAVGCAGSVIVTAILLLLVLRSIGDLAVPG